MTACLFGWKRTGFRFGCRVKHLITVKIQCSQDYAQDDDKGVGGYGNGHDRSKRERDTQKKRETTLRSHDYGNGTSGSINSVHYVIITVRSARRPLHDTAVRIHSAWVIFNQAYPPKASPLPSMLSVPTMDAFLVLVSLFASLRLDRYPNPVRMRPISAPACPNP